jgi:HD superfamily phosphodiesterase
MLAEEVSLELNVSQISSIYEKLWKTIENNRTGARIQHSIRITIPFRSSEAIEEEN